MRFWVVMKAFATPLFVFTLNTPVPAYVPLKLVVPAVIPTFTAPGPLTVPFTLCVPPLPLKSTGSFKPESAPTATPFAKVAIGASQLSSVLLQLVAAGDLAHQEIHHRPPAPDPSGVALRQGAGRAQEIPVVEMVVIQLRVAPEARGVDDERAPARIVGEDALARLLRSSVDGRGQEILQRGLEPAFAFLRRVGLAQLVRQPEQR